MLFYILCLFNFRLYIYSLLKFFGDTGHLINVIIILCKDRRVSRGDRGNLVTTLPPPLPNNKV